MERPSLPERAIGWLCWAVVAILLVVMLGGCSATFAGVCAVKALGQNQAGITFVLAQCEERE